MSHLNSFSEKIILIKFKLLLANHKLLAAANYQKLDSLYLEQTLDIPLFLPRIEHQPFILSCFASSVDGRLCYPDLKRGDAIAEKNALATSMEQAADWWSLLLARTISDAVIIGSNSLLVENYKYTIKINIDELKQIRLHHSKPEHLLHIIITRNLKKIDFANEIICQNNNIPVLIYTQGKPNKVITNFAVTKLEAFVHLEHKQIIYSNDNLDVTQLIAKLYQCGIRTILNESPYYHHELQELNLLHEMWLNTSGIYIGGNAANLGQHNSAFKAVSHPHYTILTVHAIGYNFLYTRYKIDYPQI